ncbi:hypothetical protein [Peptacetobacter sp. AB800]|uniref:hypothetical protein n=1 Tax=Peptacetobacter sp. AB800 TaxID=3388428 RepID=UPI0039FCC1A1
MIVGRIYKDTLLLKDSLKEGCNNVSFNKETFEVNEIVEDLRQGENPYIDKNKNLHVYEIREKQILE